MAKVSSVSERRSESGERRVALGASRYALFAVLWDAIDALAALPEEMSEQHVAIIQRAMLLGWRSQGEPVTYGISPITEARIAAVLAGLTPPDEDDT